MDPINSKRKEIAEPCRQGNMVEQTILDNFVPFTPRNRDGFIFVAQAFNVGLAKSRDIHAVSPDVVCVLEYTTEG
jgi:hypothetical protein